MTQDTEAVVVVQFERLIAVEKALANGSRFADDPECHPLYPQAVAARQILQERIQSMSDRIDVLEAENARLRANDVGCPVCNDRNSSMADPAENFCDKHYRLYLATWQVHPKDLDDYRAKRRAALHQEGIATGSGRNPATHEPSPVSRSRP